MKIPTLREIKRFRPSGEQIKFAELMLMSQAVVETVRPIVEGYQKAILAKHNFTNGRTVERLAHRGAAPVEVILDPKRSFELSDDDFAVYLKECNEARIASGLQTDDPDHCPLLVAENLHRQAQRAFMESMESFTGINIDSLIGIYDGIKQYNDFTESTLRLVIPFMKKKAEDYFPKAT
jgi:hypothetical protein